MPWSWRSSAIQGCCGSRTCHSPSPVRAQIRVSVAAAGINPVDTYNVKDPSWAGLSPGCVLGYDIAGTVDAVGTA